MLPYTADVWFGVIARYHQAHEIVAAAAALAGVAALALTFLRAVSVTRIISALLAAGWLWIGVVFHYQTFATLNFAAPVYALLFVAQSVLLAITGVARGRLDLRFAGGVAGAGALALGAAALVALPVADLTAGQGLNAARIALMDPTPTAALTLALLLAARAPARHLAVLPLAWSVVAGTTGWILDIPQDLWLSVACGVAAVAVFVRGHATRRQASSNADH